jgi:hypothetical protein
MVENIESGTFSGLIKLDRHSASAAPHFFFILGMLAIGGAPPFVGLIRWRALGSFGDADYELRVVGYQDWQALFGGEGEFGC